MFEGKPVTTSIKKNNINIIIFLSALIICVFLIWSARMAKRKPDQLLVQFKKVNSEIHDSSDASKQATDSSRRNSSKIAFSIREEPARELALLDNHIQLYIDSIKVKSKQRKLKEDDIRELKERLHQFNTYVHKHFLLR